MPMQEMTCGSHAYSVDWDQQLRLQTAWVAHDRHHMKSPAAYWQQQQVNETLLAKESIPKNTHTNENHSMWNVQENENAQLNSNDEGKPCKCKALDWVDMRSHHKNVHVYAHKPNMHANKWIQDANDKHQPGNSA